MVVIVTHKASIEAPFTAGLASDKEPYQLDPQESYEAEDLIASDGVARQRRGWGWHTGTGLPSGTATSVSRYSYVLADTTVTTVTSTAGDIFTLNSGTLRGTVLRSGYAPAGLYARAQYRDQTIFCASGASSYNASRNQIFGGFAIDAAAEFANSGVWTGSLSSISLSSSGNAYPGQYVYISPDTGTTSRNGNKLFRVLNGGSTGTFTLENVRASTVGTVGTVRVANIAATVPCISVYDTGVVSVSGTTATGVGVDWSDFVTAAESLGLLMIPATTGTTGTLASLGHVTSVTSGTTMTVRAPSVTNQRYALLSICTFKDVAVRDNCLYGTGVSRYPSRVYIGPPDWDMFFPPGAERPFDPSVYYETQNVNHFLLDYVDVPTSFDGDDNVALLETPNSVLVPKRDAVYAISGSFPNFRVDLVEKGSGCIDLRSAWNLPAGPVWAGYDGIYTFSGRVIDLTDKKINREWRALTDGFVEGTDICTLGQVYDHLLVSITSEAGGVQRTYCYDIAARAWISKFNNHNASFYFSARVPGEDEELLWVDSADSGRVKRSREVFDGTGSATDQSWTGTAYPRMVARTSQNLSGEYTAHSRMYDLTVTANAYDTGSTAYLSVDVNSGGGRDAAATTTKTVGTIPSDGTDRIDRHHFRAVNKAGRLHDVKITTGSTGTNTGAIEIASIEASFTTGRKRG